MRARTKSATARDHGEFDENRHHPTEVIHTMDENQGGNYLHQLQEQQHLRHIHHSQHSHNPHHSQHHQQSQHHQYYHQQQQHQYYRQDETVYNTHEKDDDDKKRRRKRSWRNLPKGTVISSLFSITWQRWKLLNKKSRFVFALIFLLVALRSIIAVMDYFYHSYGVDSVRRGRRSIQLSVPTTPAFAVIINTYKRPDILQRAVRHYGETCGRKNRVVQVFIVWAELDVTPPDPYSFYAEVDEASAAARNRATVSILRVKKDSLNSRFLPIDGLVGEALFMVDDDIAVECATLSRGFEAWRSQPYALVGYYPRLASPPLKEEDRVTKDGTKKLVYHSWPLVFWRGKFNFVLTKASFLHAMYLDLYSGPDHPQELRDYVDKHHNCEDVAMAMLVANQTKMAGPGSGLDHSPVFVEGTISDSGLFNGISTGGSFALVPSPTKHMSARSKCLTELNRMYEERGWGSPLYEVPLRDRSWVRHFPGFWWQVRPVNVFEWISFGNLFT